MRTRPLDLTAVARVCASRVAARIALGCLRRTAVSERASRPNRRRLAVANTCACARARAPIIKLCSDVLLIRRITSPFISDNIGARSLCTPPYVIWFRCTVYMYDHTCICMDRCVAYFLPRTRHSRSSRRRRMGRNARAAVLIANNSNYYGRVRYR